MDSFYPSRTTILELPHNFIESTLEQTNSIYTYHPSIDCTRNQLNAHVIVNARG